MAPRALHARKTVRDRTCDTTADFTETVTDADDDDEEGKSEEGESEHEDEDGERGSKNTITKMEEGGQRTQLQKREKARTFYFTTGAVTSPGLGTCRQ